MPRLSRYNLGHMADSVTLFQRIKETEKLLYALQNRKEQPYINFRWGDKDHSLIYASGFEDFVEQLRKSIEEFKHSSETTALTVIQLDLLGIDKEEVSKLTFRQFLNELVLKFDRDGLTKQYYYFNPNEFPFFREVDEAEISKDDLGTINFWERYVIPDFEKLAKNKDLKQEVTQETASEKIEKQPDGSVVATIRFGDGRTKTYTAAPGQTVQYERDNGTFREIAGETPPSPYSIQKLAAQEAWRDSSALMDEVLNSAFGVTDWKSLYNSLPADQQKTLDFQLFSIQEDLAGVISLYLQEKPEFALLLSQAQHLSVSDRINIRAQLIAHSNEIFGRLTKNQYFLLKTETLKEHLGLSPSQFKGSQKIAQDATVSFTEKIDNEEELVKGNYSEFQKKVFKGELKKILAFSSLSSQDSIENIAEQIIREFPLSKGKVFTDLDPYDREQFFNNFFPENAFSLGADQRTKLFSQIDACIRDLQSRANVDQANFNGFAQNKRFSRDNPKQAFASAMRSFGVDGVSEKNLRNAISAYVLAMGSPHLFDKNLEGVLDAIDPSLKNNSEALNYLKNYIIELKATLAKKTGNDLIAHSLEPDQQTPVGVTTQQYQELMKLYSQKYGDNTDLVLAQAFYNRDLANIAADISEQERYYREEGLKVRNEYLRQLQQNIEQLSKEDQAYFSNLYGVDRAQFLQEGQRELDENGQRAFNNALFEAAQGYQPWNAPDVSGQGAPGISRLRDWLGKAKGTGNLNSLSLKGVSNKLLSSQLRKAALVGGGGIAAGAGIYGLISSVIEGVAGTTLGGAAGGAVAGGAIGSIIPGVGTVVGAAIGGIIGGFAGLVKGLSDAGVMGGPSTMSSTIKSFVQSSAASSASTAGTVANAATQTITASTATLNTTAITMAVGAPIAATAVMTTLSIMMVVSAFLPDASTVQVAPYFSLDINASRYIQIKKVPNPLNSATPTQIEYTVELAKRAEATEEIQIVNITDTMTVIDKDSSPVDPPALPEDLTPQLEALKGTTLTTDAITFKFTVDASDARFSNTLVRNDIKVEYTQNGIKEEAIGRAFTCFGDCPQITVPPCWPAPGKVSQLPRAMGGPISASNSQLSPGTGSHSRFNAVLPNDAYDIGAGSMTNFPPIFAVADGIVIYADWYKGSSTLPGYEDLLLDSGYGNLTIIDHGTFVSYYAHQSEFGVAVGDSVVGGQKIGNVGTTGNSSGNHLHYEVRGFSEYVLYPTLHGDLYDPATPTCDDYYGVTN